MPSQEFSDQWIFYTPELNEHNSEIDSEMLGRWVLTMPKGAMQDHYWFLLHQVSIPEIVSFKSSTEATKNLEEGLGIIYVYCGPCNDRAKVF